VIIRFGFDETGLHWSCLRLVDEGWCSLAEVRTLTFDDVDFATDALDALTAARAQKETAS